MKLKKNQPHFFAFCKWNSLYHLSRSFNTLTKYDMYYQSNEILSVVGQFVTG